MQKVYFYVLTVAKKAYYSRRQNLLFLSVFYPLLAIVGFSRLAA